MPRLTICLAVFSLALLTGVEAAARTIRPASATPHDVQAAIDRAEDGDTVLIPAGTCVWKQPVRLGTVTWEKGGPKTTGQKHLTIQGAGIDQTILVDEVPPCPTGTDDSLFILHTVEGKPFRITGMTLKGGSTSGEKLAALRVLGSSKQVRVDHIKFDRLKTRALYVNGEIYGVIDHCQFITDSGKQAIWVGHNNWLGRNYGDGSWASPLALGTANAVYIEDNLFRAEGAWTAPATVDSWMGGRWVFRHNHVENMTIGNHGTESSGRWRGCFSMEIYENRFHRSDPTPFAFMGHFRSGTCVIFNNTATGTYNAFVVTDNYREFHAFVPWGACDGTSPFDLNDGVVYDSGVHAGPNQSPVLKVPGKNWTPNQWAGYCVHNLRRGDSIRIRSNTADTITVESDSYKRKDGPFAWNTGDAMKIMKAQVCLDGIGRSTGVLLSGDSPVPRRWPEQALEPLYAWNNTLNGKPARLASRSILVQQGREYYNETRRPGYKPYPYPHPLIAFFDAQAPAR